jgi:hypothetical protein
VNPALKELEKEGYLGIMKTRVPQATAISYMDYVMKKSRTHLMVQTARLVLPLLMIALLASCAGQTPIESEQTAPPAGATSTPAKELEAIPLLAYYYIWFDPKSWDRAKTDIPLLGPYSSDDRKIMQQHIRWAKAAGIKGFIVSWKSSETLNRRLKQLIEVANEEDFKLLIIYQGLDFTRNPIAADRIGADLDYFIQQFANNKAFSLFDRPVVIWSGTWKYSHEDVAKVTEARRKRLLILASERSPEAYQRLANVVDGDAYYWSSVNPATFPNYQAKLDTMAQAIHANSGLWFAPAAVGFDARLIGGTKVVDRKDGQTLRTQLNAALQSSPDAVGLISWNEFSENSYVEPSRTYGKRYLDVLTDFHSGATPKAVDDLDSSMPGESVFRAEVVTPLAAMAIVTLASLGVIVRRALRAQ